MARQRRPDLRPITTADVAGVASFLADHMSSGVSAPEWARALNPPWPYEQPNHGFQLREADSDKIVGAYLAFYSERTIAGQIHKICNLAAWCVLDDYRADGLRMLRKLLAQPGYDFTDLSPSGNVIALNERLGFQQLDTATALSINLPWPVWSKRLRVFRDADAIAGLLHDDALQVHLDHAELGATRQVLLVFDGAPCLVLYRRDRRKRLRLFASVLYVSDRAVFERARQGFRRHVLLRRGLPFTLAERRVTGSRAPRSIMWGSRARMFRSRTLRPDDIDYLYSELTGVPW